MPAKWFICPSGDRVEITECLDECPKGIRCMLLPTLRAIVESLNREIVGFSVTELLLGTREIYLKKKLDYAVDPQKRLNAIWGSGIHTIHERNAYGNIRSEERLYGEHCSGKYDLYGEILSYDRATLADIKTSNAFKIRKALGFYKVDVPTGEVFKSGLRKGQPKTKKEGRTGGVRHLLDWAIQVNYYRMLLEAEGRNISDMVIQAICRDNGALAEDEYNLNKAVHLIPINRISDIWISRYLGYKAVLLEMSLMHHQLPPACSYRECWGGRKCEDFCEVASFCDFGKKVKAAKAASQ